MESIKIALLDLHRGNSDIKKIENCLSLDNIVKVESIRITKNEIKEVNINDYDGIVLTGSNTSNIKRYRGYKLTIKYILEAEELGIPILGICAGHQLLAEIHRFNIEELLIPERGWYNIYLTEPGKNDPLFINFPKNEEFPVFLHHKYVVENNNKLNVLAYNEHVQAVKYSNLSYGVQFHPEETIESAYEFLKNNPKKSPVSELKPKRTPQLLIFHNYLGIVRENKNKKNKIN